MEEKKKKRRTRYQIVKLNLGSARRRIYLETLRKRYGRPKSGLSRLIICALREVLALEQQGIPPSGQTTQNDA